MFSKILTAGLLLFVAASIVVPLVRHARHDSPEPTLLQAGMLQDNRTIVYYFRSHIRCPACRTVEQQSRAIVEREFADALLAGKLVWQSLDYQSSGNEHFVEDFQLVAPSVVIVEVHNGQPQTWKTLGEAWNLAGDPPALAAYLKREIAAVVENRP